MPTETTTNTSPSSNAWWLQLLHLLYQGLCSLLELLLPIAGRFVLLLPFYAASAMAIGNWNWFDWSGKQWYILVICWTIWTEWAILAWKKYLHAPEALAREAETDADTGNADAGKSAREPAVKTTIETRSSNT